MKTNVFPREFSINIPLITLIVKHEATVQNVIENRVLTVTYDVPV